MPFRKKATTVPAEVDILKGIFLADPTCTREVLPTMLAAHMRWLIKVYYLQQLEPVADVNMPIALVNFKLGMVLMASPSKDLLELMLVETEVATGKLVSDDLFPIYKQRASEDKTMNDLRKVTKIAFAQAFKLFVMGGKAGMGCYRLTTDIALRKSTHTATGWKLKANNHNLFL